MAKGRMGVKRHFFRIVKSNPPSIDDFISAQARGRAFRPGLPDEFRRLWDGISVYATVAQARRKARQSPMLGQHVAEVQLDEHGPVRWERTTREAGHHTLWGDPADILRRVVAVDEVTPRSKQELES